MGLLETEQKIVSVSSELRSWTSKTDGDNADTLDLGEIAAINVFPYPYSLHEQGCASRMAEMVYVTNQTSVTEIHLKGFGNLQDFRFPVFFLFLIIYLLTVIGNVVIILLVSISYRLHTPMFFFLGNLSISDIMLTSNIVPSLLNITLSGGGTLPLKGCIIQYFIYGESAGTECLLLTAMSYDRYIAICNPLRYTIIMDNKLCFSLVVLCWILGFIISIIPALCLQTLFLCGPNVIDHFFCDMGPLLELSCSDASIVKYEVIGMAGFVTTVPFVFITVTYGYIFVTVMRITSATGRQKTFSTCSSHLTVVCTYYGALFAMYVAPSRGFSQHKNKIISLIYTVVTPLFNPIIYSLRNPELKATMWKYISIICKKKHIK